MISWSIINSYEFLVIAAGTGLLAFAAGAIGCLTVLKGQSLIGDAIGNSAFPGIILAFMLFATREPVYLLLGAISTGACAFLYIQVLKDHCPLPLDALLAITLSSFFGLGMVLKTYIQGNPSFQHASQSGLQTYIFGQAAYIMKSDLFIILTVSIISLSFLLLFYKEFYLFLFDPVHSKIVGMPPILMHTITLISTLCLIATGLKVVGAILISALFILPAITALQWSYNFKWVLLIAAFTGALSSIIGTYISTLYEGMSTGPTIILCLGIIALLSLVLGPKGTVRAWWHSRGGTL